MQEVLSLFNDFQKTKKVVSVYTNQEDTSRFAAGIVAAVSEEDVLLMAIAPDGTYDGYQTIPLSDIYMACADGTYEEDLGKLYSAQEKRHLPFHTEDTNLRRALLAFALQTGYCVSLELCKSGKWDIQGKVLSLSDETVCIDVFDESYRGKSFIEIARISELEADSCDEQALEKEYSVAGNHSAESQETQIEEIARLFYSDTLALLDSVLSEDAEQPEHSANTVWSRLELAAAYRSGQAEAPVEVPMLLKESGYPQEAIDTLIDLCTREKEHHKALCEAQNCNTERYEKTTPGW